jgi:hypothetical protein
LAIIPCDQAGDARAAFRRGVVMNIYLKDRQASVEYVVDWPAALIGDATIAASLWEVAPDEDGGVAVAGSAIDEARTSATLGGGIPGRVYRIRNRITLSDGRSDARSLSLRVEER